MVEVDGVEFRTVDIRVRLAPQWKFLPQAVEVCGYMGVQVAWLRSDRAYIYPERASITVRPPTNLRKLQSLVNAAAYVGFKNLDWKPPECRKAFEAHSFTMQYLKYLEITPKRNAINGGICNVGRLIAWEIKSGRTRIDRESWEYARSGSLPGRISISMDSINPIFNDLSRNNGYREALSAFDPGAHRAMIPLESDAIPPQ